MYLNHGPLTPGIWQVGSDHFFELAALELLKLLRWPIYVWICIDKYIYVYIYATISSSWLPLSSLTCSRFISRGGDGREIDVYVYIHRHEWLFLYTHIHVYVHTYTYIFMHTSMHTFMHILHTFAEVYGLHDAWHTIKSAYAWNHAYKPIHLYIVYGLQPYTSTV